MSRFALSAALAAAALCLLAQPAAAQVATATVPIAISTATSTELVVGISGTSIRGTHWDIIAGGTGNITFASADPGSSCLTNVKNLTGTYQFTPQAGDSVGGGYGWILIAPPGKSLCAITTAAAAMSGSVSYAQN